MHAAADGDPRLAQRAAEREPGRERRIRGQVTPDPVPVDDERRERRRLVEVEARFPTGNRAARVKPGIIRDDVALDATYTGRAHLCGERLESPVREGRVAAALEHE